MKFIKRFWEWINEEMFVFDAEYDRIHHEINENPSIIIDAIKMAKDKKTES